MVERGGVAQIPCHQGYNALNTVSGLVISASRFVLGWTRAQWWGPPSHTQSGDSPNSNPRLLAQGPVASPPHGQAAYQGWPPECGVCNHTAKRPTRASLQNAASATTRPSRLPGLASRTWCLQGSASCREEASCLPQGDSPSWPGFSPGKVCDYC